MNLRTLIRRITGSDVLFRVEDLAIQLAQTQDENSKLRARLAAVENDRDTYQKHSILANQLGWRIAEAVGDVPEGSTRVEGDPMEQLDRLIKDRDRQRSDAAESQDELRHQVAIAARNDEQLDTADAMIRRLDGLVYEVRGVLENGRGKTARDALTVIERHYTEPTPAQPAENPADPT